MIIKDTLKIQLTSLIDFANAQGFYFAQNERGHKFFENEQGTKGKKNT